MGRAIVARVRIVASGALAVAILAAAPAGAASSVPPVPHDPVLIPKGKARGVVLAFHGGAWASSGDSVRANVRPEAQGMQASGWIVHNLDYRAGAASLVDVVAAVRWARARYPRRTLCLYGESAGGHLALVAAARVKGVACVIGQGTPTDLMHWTSIPANAEGLVAAARTYFGRAARTTANPIWLARRGRLDRTRILLQHGVDDPMVEFEQATRFCRAARTCTLAAITSGDVPFTHGLGARVSLVAVWEKALAMMRRAARR